MRVFSGIQATGAKHIGNYIGAMRQYVSTQDEGDAFFCIVDLHSITADYEPADLRERTSTLRRLLFAVGLEPERSTLFLQSHVTAHAEAAWLLSAVAEVRPTRPYDAVQGEGRAAGVHLRRPLHLSGPDGGRHPALPDRRRAGRRRPAAAHRARARHRAALQLALRRDVHGPAAASTRRSVRGSWICRSRRRRCRRPAGRRRGRAACSTTAGHDPQEVQDRRHRLGPRGARATPRSPASRT